MPEWESGGGLPGIDGTVRGLHSWDADGPGGAPAVLVACGAFRVAGSAVTSHIAMQDAVTGEWSSIGTGAGGSLGDEVRATATLPNGDLVAGGTFSLAGGVSANNIARWDGSTWSPMGGGFVGGGIIGTSVRTLAVLANGDLIAGGYFTASSGVGVNAIARWNGSTWSPLGTGLTSSNYASVDAIAIMPNGDLIVSGGFQAAGGVPASNIARWDGSAWSPLGTGLNSWAVSLLARPNGDVIAGGAFNIAGGVGAGRIARWDGSAWSPLGSGVGVGNSAIRSLHATPGGDVVAGGSFLTAGGVSANCIARWNGSTWSPIGAGVEGDFATVNALHTEPNGDLVAGGYFATAGKGAALSIARWNGINWSPLATGTDSQIRELITAANGDLIAGGDFTTIDGVNANRIARLSGGVWSPLGTGLNGLVLGLAELPNGDVIAGGQFTMAGGMPANNIARWNGATWSPLGTGFSNLAFDLIRTLAVLPNGDLIAGGQFLMAGGVPATHIARWNGSTWSPVSGGVDSVVLELEVMPNGDLIACGGFQSTGSGSANSIARWDGSAWTPLGAGLSGEVITMHVLPNGELIVGGFLRPAGGGLTGVVRWDGSTWSTIGAGWNNYAYSLTALPNGDIIAGGEITAAGGVARWDGQTWSPLGAGLVGFRTFVAALELRHSGHVAVGGNFTSIDGFASAHFARYVSTCPASATVSAVGCPSSGGANTLTATNLPWAGSTFRTEGVGMPSLAFVGVVSGFTTTSLPLSAVLAQGQPGCTLAVSPDHVDFLLSTTGSAQSLLTLPNTSTLAGIVFHQQMIPFELDAALNLTAVTATNALSMTVGSF